MEKHDSRIGWLIVAVVVAAAGGLLYARERENALERENAVRDARLDEARRCSQFLAEVWRQIPAECRKICGEK